jgi:pimeloyl-ACP methyl ester carboxylesterase
MSSPALAPGEAPVAPLRGELRYGIELTRLLLNPGFHRPARRHRSPAVMLIPGFMAGDSSLRVLAHWLRRRGSRTSGSGIVVNAACAERTLEGVQSRLRTLADRAGGRVVLVGQSRGGELARVAAVRNPDLVSTVVMLGSPVLGPLHVAPVVLGAVRSIAKLGDIGLPGVFSTRCGDGACCESFREELFAPMPDGVRAVAIYSRSDAIVSWEACLDPFAEHVEVQSSHGGMSVHPGVYRALEGILQEAR